MEEPKRLLEMASLAPDARQLLEAYGATPALPPDVGEAVAANLANPPAAVGGALGLKGSLLILTLLGVGAVWFGVRSPTPTNEPVAAASAAAPDPSEVRGAAAMGDEGEVVGDGARVGGDDAPVSGANGAVTLEGRDANGAAAGKGAFGANGSAAVEGAFGANGTDGSTARNDANGSTALESARGSNGSTAREGVSNADGSAARNAARDANGSAARNAARDANASTTRSAPNALANGPAERAHRPEAKGDDMPGDDETAAPDDGGLAAELSILDAGRRALETAPATTLERVAAHRARFPDGQLADLRDFLEIQALLGLKSHDRAQARAARFLEVHRGSALIKELERALEDHR